MGLQLKIIGATPKSGKSICLTCKHGKVIRGQNCEEVVICKAGLWDRFGSCGPVRFRVSDCAEYHPSNMPWKWEMEEMAWKIEARKRGPTGFQPDQPTEMEIIISPPKSSPTGDMPDD